MRWLIAVLLAGGCIGAVSAQAALPAADGEDCVAPSAGLGRATTGASRFVAGRQAHYQLSFRSEAQYDFTVLFQKQGAAQGPQSKAPNALAQDVRLSLSAGVEMTAIDRVGLLQRVMVRFIQPVVQVQSGGLHNEPLAVTVAQDLRAPVFIDLESSGRIAGLSVPPASHGMTQGLIRTVLALSQFTAPARGDWSHPWATEEGDPNGTFPVRYEPLAAKGDKPGAVVRLRKTRYGQTSTEAPAIGAHAATLAKEFLPTGSMVIAYDRSQGRVISVTGAETLENRMNHKRVGQSRSELRLVHQASHCVAAEERAKLLIGEPVESTWKSLRVPLSNAIQSAADDDRMIARSTLGEDTLETLLALVRRVSAGPQAGLDETAVYLKLKALATLKPDACAPITDHLLTLGPDDRGYRLVVSALSAVGHDPAQGALRRLVARAQGERALLSLLVALATVDRPTRDTLALFERYAVQAEPPQVATTAQLGLGVFARKLWRDDRATSEALVRDFVRQLDASTDMNGRLHWLSVLGNGGTPSEFEPVARYLADPSPVVRSVAISALRWQTDPRVNPLLIAALRDDPDENARSSAARTLDFRKVGPSAFAAFKRALARDASARVRNLILVMLWQLRADYPEAVALVGKAAENDPEPNVRNAAKELLKPMAAQSAGPSAQARARQ